MGGDFGIFVGADVGSDVGGLEVGTGEVAREIVIGTMLTLPAPSVTTTVPDPSEELSMRLTTNPTEPSPGTNASTVNSKYVELGPSSIKNMPVSVLGRLSLAKPLTVGGLPVCGSNVTMGGSGSLIGLMN